jgi:hypothetical protein
MYGGMLVVVMHAGVQRHVMKSCMEHTLHSAADVVLTYKFGLGPPEAC